jgi:hypothetical protein
MDGWIERKSTSARRMEADYGELYRRGEGRKEGRNFTTINAVLNAGE